MENITMIDDNQTTMLESMEMTTEFLSTIASVFDLDTIPPNLTINKPVHKAQLLLYDILIPALGTIIILLNFAVVLSSGLILKKGSQPRSTYLFLGNVALCDLVTGVAVLLGQFYPKQYRDHITCGISLGLIVSSTLTSIYSVGLIAIDRYLYIIHGLQYQQWVYPMRARLLILFTWVIGGVVGFLPVMGWSGDTLNGKICWFIRLVPPKLVMMTCIIGLIPIIVVVVLYSIILYHAIKKVIQLRRAGQNTNNPNQSTGPNNLRINVARGSTTESSDIEELSTNQTQEKQNIIRRFFTKKRKVQQEVKAPSKSKAVTVVLLVTGSFIITWVPYFVASFIYVNCDPEKTPGKCRNLQILIASPLAILGFCNSLLNPIIYAWWHQGFRSSVKKMFTRKITKFGGSSSGTTKSTNISSKKTSISSNADRVRIDSIQLENVQLNTKL